MRLTIFGSGYVGLVQGACMAEMGNHVVCYDIDEDKIARLNDGEIPIFEPGLEDYVERNVKAGRLEFTTDVKKAVDHGLFQFIAVGTPPDEDGSADLKHVLAVAKAIGENMDEYRVVVDKSTVPVGTADKVKAEIASVLGERGKSVEFDVVSNPNL
jgi:UDPglucose 6-dehydrogenase